MCCPAAALGRRTGRLSFVVARETPKKKEQESPAERAELGYEMSGASPNVATRARKGD